MCLPASGLEHCVFVVFVSVSSVLLFGLVADNMAPGRGCVTDDSLPVFAMCATLHPFFFLRLLHDNCLRVGVGVFSWGFAP